jgi:hypothetical protein
MASYELKISTEDTLAIIMGGGAGTRLFPLTKERAKPAVPLAGKYRLVDIPSPVNLLPSFVRRAVIDPESPGAHLWCPRTRPLYGSPLGNHFWTA